MKTNLVVIGATVIAVVALAGLLIFLVAPDGGSDDQNQSSDQDTEVIDALTQDANTPALLADLAAGKVDQIMRRISWVAQPCTGPDANKGAAERCADGVAAGTLVSMFDVGPGDFQFWVTEATLRRTLEVVLPGGLQLGYAGRTDSGGDLFIGMDGPPKGKGMPPISSPDTDLVGLVVRYDAQRDQIREMSLIGMPSSAAQTGFVIAAGVPQEVIFVRTPSQ